MANDIEKKIEKLEKAIERAEKTLEAAIKAAFADGKFKDHERRAIEDIQETIADYKKKIVELNAKRGVVDFEDEPMEIGGDQVAYDSSTFRTVFKQSVNNWCQDKAIKLNSIRNFMIERKEPAGLSLKDVVSVVELAIPAASKLKTVLDMIEIAEKAMNSMLGPSASLNDIHRSWSKALDDIDNNSGKLYDQFVKDWKKKNGVPDNAHKVPRDIFMPACESFRKDYLPDAGTVEKAFVTKILSTVKDGWDWNSGAGFADCALGTLGGEFWVSSAQLDDVPKDMLQAVQTVYGKSTKVIDLPIEVVVTIVPPLGVDSAVAKRTSKSPGNTSFKLESGDQGTFDVFMRKKAYNFITVGDLKVDS